MGGTMSSITISGDTSGSVILQAPNVAGSTTLTLPSTSGTVVTTNTIPAGQVIQVVQTIYNTEFSTTSNTFADIGLSASITPSSSSNKVLVFYSIGYLIQDTNLGGIQLLRGSTILQSSIRAAASSAHASYMHNEYLDSPSTTSSVTYKIQSNKNTGNAFATCWNAQQPSSITLMEIKA